MYYSNKGLKPTTACVIVRRKKRHVTGIEQINCRFIGNMFVFFAIFVRVLPRISTSARKTLCSATLSKILKFHLGPKWVL